MKVQIKDYNLDGTDPVPCAVYEIPSDPEAGWVSYDALGQEWIRCPVEGCTQQLHWNEAGNVPGYRVCAESKGNTFDPDTIKHRFFAAGSSYRFVRPLVWVGFDGDTPDADDVDWIDHVPYVACVYGPEGDEPGNCAARWGTDPNGLWWVDDGDNDERSGLIGPFVDELAAVVMAEALADAGREPGTEHDADAEATRTRLEDEARARATADGSWLVLWCEENESDFTIGHAYEDRADAEQEIDAWYRRVLEATPRALTHLMRHPVLGHRTEDGISVCNDDD